jgi:hypothetical protein
MKNPRQNGLWAKHGEEIIAMLREAIRPGEIARSIDEAKGTVETAISRYYNSIGIPDDRKYDRHTLFALRQEPLQQEIEKLKAQLTQERCPFPDLRCPHLGRRR